MSGKGSEVGGTFQEIRAIIDKIKLDEKIGVCLDTCHVHDAGYDIVNNLDGVLDEFDRIVGLERLRAIHLNDSKNPFASHKDRHEKIGDGSIGLKSITDIIQHPKLRHLPFFLETPNELDGYAAEIRLLRNAFVE
jgi:deoxyribonuclease IV